MASLNSKKNGWQVLLNVWELSGPVNPLPTGHSRYQLKPKTPYCGLSQANTKRAVWPQALNVPSHLAVEGVKSIAKYAPSMQRQFPNVSEIWT